jgi:hypothetical protein
MAFQKERRALQVNFVVPFVFPKPILIIVGFAMAGSSVY